MPLKITAILLTNIFFVFTASFSAGATTTTTLTPDSAKECAICHYGWVDTFFIQKRGTYLVALPDQDTAADEEMCFSCHDGSTVDSRKKVHNDRKHQVGIVPSEKVKIPEIFPLDAEGKMACATCHSAHGVSTEPGIEKTIFLRTSNLNSEMCTMCHVGKEGGPEKGNHPVNKTTLAVPDIITAFGGYTGSEPNQIICESCHVAHGGFTDQRLVLPVDQPGIYPVLCEACHGKTPGRNQDPKRNLFSHSVDRKPADAKIPGTWNNGEDVRLGSRGEIVCVTCHSAHSPATNKSLLSTTNEQDSLCLQCHASQEKLIRNNKHDLRVMAPDAENSRGKTVSQSGPCSCCHFTHEGSGPFMWAREWSGEEKPPVGICKSCHAKGACADEAPIPETGHPIGVQPKDEKSTAEFPLYLETGSRDSGGAVFCSSCHNSHQWDPLNPDNKGSKDEKGDSSNSFLRETSQNSSLCLGCHKEQESLLKTDHDLSQSAPQEKNMIDQAPEQSGVCGSCHLAHGGASTLMWGRRLPEGDDPIMAKLCLECHREGSCGEKKTLGNYMHSLDVSVGITPEIKLPLYRAEGTQDPQGKVVCSTCHNSHQWDPGDPQKRGEEGTQSDSFLRLTSSGNSPLCSECHPDKSHIQDTEHDLRVSATDEKNKQGALPGESGLCEQCHAVHNASIGAFIWNREVGPLRPEGGKEEFIASDNLMVGLCTGCHAPDQCGGEKQVEYGLHPSKLYMAMMQERSAELNESAFATFIGQYPIFTADGAKTTGGDIVCSTCHDAHLWDARFPKPGPGEKVEGNATNSFLRKDIAATFCASCHGEESLFKFKYFHALKGRMKEKKSPAAEDESSPLPSP